ncbi:CPBP family glutamic-type intramembrane protease [Paenibacillus hexagrammi]|uniref:CPBP family glutamic-type intramembrane protease n=1 Tax=Paenibacillus hexagrammi TaxID=2908839 RepID=A0ABY3SFM5_9BACL|nr:CPBP family intramembrane glutamic endopeptidase [Paenibacillus sp. YPD9-1]UJF32263.1 CPBP family glutamic-type intramembrane protease [Paenibacillus sp. YPD9-1]
MNRLKLNRPLLILACIGIVLYFGINMWSGLQSDEAAPSENPTIAKQQAAEAAAQFIQDRYGITISSTKTFVVYQSKKTRSGYLQKEHIVEAYSLKYGERFPIDYYQVTVLEPETKRQFQVEVNYTNAHIFGWKETDTKALRSAPISRQRADLLSRQEMTRLGFNPDDFVAVDDSSSENPTASNANTYLYEKQSDAIGSSKLRLQLDFDDQAIIGSTVQFSIPPEHQAWLDQQDRSASIMTWISMGFTFLMSIAAVVYAVKYRKQMEFRRGLLLTILFTTIYIANNINMYPAFKAMAGYENGGLATLLSTLFMNVVTMLLGLSVYISLTAGSKLWEISGKTHIWSTWKDSSFGSEVSSGMGRGYLIALFILGVQQVLFFAGEANFDVWAVNDPTDSVLNQLEPKLFPLMAWAAAISEEAAYRVLGILLFKKLLRNNFIAVLIPSIIWAASHTQYPIYPVYTRLIEVTVIGMILGYVFLKYGFLTSLFAHASMDSILMGLSLFSLGKPSDVLTGIFYVLLPALAGLVIAWLHRKTCPRSPIRSLT